MKNGFFATFLIVAVVVVGDVADAQQTGKIFRIGFLDRALLPVARSSWRRSGKS